MRMTLPPFAIVILLGLSASTRLPAQTGSPGAIRGMVINDATGNFVEGAVVLLSGTSRPTPRST